MDDAIDCSTISTKTPIPVDRMSFARPVSGGMRDISLCSEMMTGGLRNLQRNLPKSIS